MNCAALLLQMSEQDLASYQFQLNQVTEALERNPDNAELLKLQSDLRELVALASSLLETTKAANGNERIASGAGRLKHLTKSQTVMAKWEDGKFYEAIIESLPDGKDDASKVAVKFKDYPDIEYVNVNDICEFPSGSKRSQGGFDYSKKKSGNNVVIPQAPVTPATAAAVLNASAKTKKKYKVKPPESQKKSESQHALKQKAWLSFISSATGSKSSEGKVKKRPAEGSTLVKPFLKKPSMFSTPSDPMARVGVIGSGKPMTQFSQRGKHIFPLKT